MPSRVSAVHPPSVRRWFRARPARVLLTLAVHQCSRSVNFVIWTRKVKIQQWLTFNFSSRRRQGRGESGGVTLGHVALTEMAGGSRGGTVDGGAPTV